MATNYIHTNYYSNMLLTKAGDNWIPCIPKSDNILHYQQTTQSHQTLSDPLLFLRWDLGI